MAKIKFKPDQDAETMGGGGGGVVEKIRGIYTLQICEASDGVVVKEGPNKGVPRTNFRLEVADDDERGQLGQWVFHSVNWIPRGGGDKAAGGHGMAVHFLHATNMPFDGEFEFDEQDFTQEGHAVVRALLEVESYTKVKDGKSFENLKYVVREIYTDTNPEPSELPPPPAKKRAPVTRTPVKTGASPEELLESVPF